MKNRTYRQWIKTDDLIQTRISVKETDLLILSKTPLDLKYLRYRIGCLRQDIKDYIAKDRRFAADLKPISVELNAPLIIRQMARAAKLANVGPMAAVAGGIAQMLAEDLLNRGVSEIIIENGGDIFLTRQKRERSIAVFAGDSKLSGKIALLLEPDKTPCGICASSATLGHSLSFGNADSAVILAEDAFLADTVATATCNLVKSNKDFNQAAEFAKKIPGVFGLLIILGDDLVSWGEVQLIRS